MTENNTEAKKHSIFIEERENEEFLVAIDTQTRLKIAEEIADFTDRIAFGQDACDGMVTEQEEFGADSYPPVALAIQKLGNAQLASDKAWLAVLKEVQAEFYPEEVKSEVTAEESEGK